MLALPLDVDSLPPLEAADPTDAEIQGAFAPTDLVSGRATIAEGLDLGWSLALDHQAIALEGYVRGIVVWSAMLSYKQPCASWRGRQGHLKKELKFCVDLQCGELTVTGDVCVLVGDARRCYRFPTVVLAAWSPTLGAVGGDILAHPPAVDGGSAGASRSIVPTVTRIPVDTQSRVGTPVGGHGQGGAVRGRP